MQIPDQVQDDLFYFPLRALRVRSLSTPVGMVNTESENNNLLTTEHEEKHEIATPVLSGQ